MKEKKTMDKIDERISEIDRQMKELLDYLKESLKSCGIQLDIKQSEQKELDFSVLFSNLQNLRNIYDALQGLYLKKSLIESVIEMFIEEKTTNEQH